MIRAASLCPCSKVMYWYLFLFSVAKRVRTSTPFTKIGNKLNLDYVAINVVCWTDKTIYQIGFIFGTLLNRMSSIKDRCLFIGNPVFRGSRDSIGGIGGARCRVCVRQSRPGRYSRVPTSNNPDWCWV